jgi:1-aminocyclopropane-1-carboxylate deaminase
MLEFESLINIPTPLIEILDDLFVENDVKVFVKRDDLTHEHVSGNKFRKLKYNLL